jgi:hypothetical protein
MLAVGDIVWVLVFERATLYSIQLSDPFGSVNVITISWLVKCRKRHVCAACKYTLLVLYVTFQNLKRNVFLTCDGLDHHTRYDIHVEDWKLLLGC